MSVFDIISLLGGLAMFLYGMRIMGDGLKESSSGTLKKAIERLTNTHVKAFLLGLFMTALIQSSTATIVITSGLVGAGLLSLNQSVGIIVGANVGTTVTGQIIRLLDIDSSGTSFLRFLQPSTLAPVALILGILCIMGLKFKSSDKVGKIVIGFGILFSGLMNMTDAVNVLSESGMIDSLFTHLGQSPILGYIIGAAVAFVLQSSSASIGILQAFSMSGALTFSSVYAVLVGIYLGDCVTTAIVCNIGAKPDAKRVGTINILFNLSKSILILGGVYLAYRMGWLGNIWDKTINSGGIANANTVFNLACAILLFPLLSLYKKLSFIFVRDKKDSDTLALDEKLDALNPIFFKTPAIAFGHCSEALSHMYNLARSNIADAFNLITAYDTKRADKINRDEERIDMMADKISNYLILFSAHITSDHDVELLNYYHGIVSEFERLGDHATNIAEIAQNVQSGDSKFSKKALYELSVLKLLIETILDYSYDAFKNKSVTAARHIEPLEEVTDDMVMSLKDNHLDRLRIGSCSVNSGTEFLNLLSDIERISDICSNIGVSTIANLRPELRHEVHDYASSLHSGHDAEFNREYEKAHKRYFDLLTGES